MKIELEDKEMDYIAQVLGARPYVEVANLMNKIGAQVREQQASAPAELKEVMKSSDDDTHSKLA